MHDVLSIPIGFLDVIQMFPLDFQEFISAIGVSKKIINYLSDCFKKKQQIDIDIHKQMIKLFNTYLIIGGMPKAVSNFIENNDIYKVNLILNEIDYGYKQDIAKYDKQNRMLIQDIYDLIPNELNNQNKRFILKDLNTKARFYKYETSFIWLKNNAMGLFVHNVDNPIFPLLASKERTLFKLFLSDVELLTYKLFNGNQIQILNNDLTLNFGAIYEAVVAQELKSHRFDFIITTIKK
ncbi:DUF4143 domain-containing protein [Metamycoplasma equirhinis]|uniref:DUF4143 domain-containing protein n=1 Tax=Metamycoplasma equirhinis TaxID=92402 RepID=UPI0035933366